jgi:hypothetical protein
VKDITWITIAGDMVSHKPKTYGFIEMWNPSPEQLTALVPWLEENLTVAFIWVYGEPEDIPDYSNVPVGRYTQPYWLGRTKESAYKMYSANRELLIGDM